MPKISGLGYLCYLQYLIRKEILTIKYHITITFIKLSKDGGCVNLTNKICKKMLEEYF